MFQCVCVEGLPGLKSILPTEHSSPSRRLSFAGGLLAAPILLLTSLMVHAQPVKIEPVYQSGFESGAISLSPGFSAVIEGSLNANTQPGPLVLQMSSPVGSDTFVPITSSEPARLDVPGGGVVVGTGLSSAVVTVNAYQAGATPVVLTARLGNILTAGVRVEKVLNETGVAGEMDYCATVFPPYASARTGTSTPATYARVFEAGITEFASPPGGWLVGAGFGPVGTDPRLLADWQWKLATYNLQAGNDDEYTATLLAPQASGIYTYAFRMSLDGGGSWTYCDYDGAGSNGGLDFSVAQLPRMYVYGDDVRNGTGEPAEADYCVLQFPANLSVAASGTATTVFGRLFELGVTEAAGAPGGWTAQVGFGPLDSDPRVPVGWTFFNASFNVQVVNDDEFGAAMTAPATPGQYLYVFRVSQDGGTSWTYCDLDGAGSNGSAPFLPSQLGVMTVNPP